MKTRNPQGGIAQRGCFCKQRLTHQSSDLFRIIELTQSQQGDSFRLRLVRGCHDIDEGFRIGIELHKSLNDRMFQSSALHGRRALKKRFDGLSDLHPAQGLRRSASDLGIGMPQTIHDCFRCPCVMMDTNGVQGGAYQTCFGALQDASEGLKGLSGMHAAQSPNNLLPELGGNIVQLKALQKAWEARDVLTNQLLRGFFPAPDASHR